VSPDGTSDRDFLAGFMDDYFAECDEHLTAIRRALLTAEAQGALPAPALDELFRGVHSLKGLSGIVELRDAELLAHHLESFLGALRRKETTLTSAGVSALIASTRLLEQVIAARRDQAAPPAIDAAIAAIERLAADSSHQTGNARAGLTAPAAAADANAPPRWDVVFTPNPELAARGVSVDRVRALLREAGDILDAAPRVEPGGGISFEFLFEGALSAADVDGWREQGIVATRRAETPAVEADSAVPAAAAPALLAPSHYVRVDLAKLDELMRMIGDLVISRARLGDSLARLESQVPAVLMRAVQENALVIERQLRDLREGVMRVRLVPVGEIFRRMPFVVRDLARETGKQVELEMRGQDTEIDKFLIERMLDPVLHLVRNAVSHGIESVEERRAAGKPDLARITLSAATVGDLVLLEIADDGRGVDAAQVVTRARAQGLLVPAGPTDAHTLLNILCAPGFSTRDAADRASGRGVGMAVVQTAVQELGGKLTLDSTPGQGSRFIIELPVTLAITDAIIARVGPQTFAVPQTSVREVVEIDPATIRRFEHNEIAPHRDGVLPIVRLADAFGLTAVPGRSLHVFVIGHGQSAVGLAVDRIIGQREVVVRTLADAFVKVDGIVGATDLGDGRVVLILDASRLTAMARTRRAATAAGKAHP
jgi:two-component system chemotaxis sensor kinase CheA